MTFGVSCASDDDGRRDRTDQVGLESTESMSSDFEADDEVCLELATDLLRSRLERVCSLASKGRRDMRLRQMLTDAIVYRRVPNAQRHSQRSQGV